MKLSGREAVLTWLVGLLLLGGLSYALVAPKVRIWMDIEASKKQGADRIALLERMLQERDEWTRRVDVLKTKLAHYEGGQDVSADYLKILERLAKDSSLNLIRRQPQKEKRHGDLYELAIECTWEGSLEGLVRFLFALERESVAMDVGELTVSMTPGGKKQLKGNFSVVCIYSRTGLPQAAAAPPAAAPKKPAAVPE